MTRYADLQLWHNGARKGRVAIGIPCCDNPVSPHYRAPASGYGKRLQMPYMVFWRNKWRRVYCAQFGNAGSPYIGKPGAWEAVIDAIY